MSFFRSIRKLFDTGGTKIKLSGPTLFAFDDPSLPVTVTITGHKSEPRTVTEFDIALREVADDKNDSGGPSGHALMEWRLGGPLQLAPGETRVVELDVPLGDRTEVLGEELGGVGRAFAKLTTLTQRSEFYTLQVAPVVEGANGMRHTSRRLQRRQPGAKYFGSYE